MEQWMTKCLRLGKPRHYLTYTEVNEFLPDDQVDPEKLNEFLLLLEAEGIELRDDPTPNPGSQGEILFHRFAPELLEGWKSYPVRVRGPRPSECHGSPTLLVQSMAGGFVSANCSECGKKHLLGRADFFSLFLWVSCPRCRRQMESEMLPRIKRASRLAANYGYKCARCRIYILLADLLPHWEDLM